MKWTISILFLMIITGCSLERRMSHIHKFIEKHPETLVYFQDTVVKIERDTVIRIDTVERILHVYIEPEIDSSQIEVEHVYDTNKLDEWGSPWHTETDTVTASAGFSEAIAYVADGTLHLKLWQNDSLLNVSYDSISKQIEYYENLYMTELLKVKVKEPIKWYYKAAVWGWLGALVIALFLFLILGILKKIK